MTVTVIGALTVGLTERNLVSTLEQSPAVVIRLRPGATGDRAGKSDELTNGRPRRAWHDRHHAGWRVAVKRNKE